MKVQGVNEDHITPQFFQALVVDIDGLTWKTAVTSVC